MLGRAFAIVAPALALALYYLGLFQRPATASSRAMTHELVEEVHEDVRAGRPADALAPLLRLTRAYPRNHVYLGELAGVFQGLRRPEDEARIWERYVEVAPLPYEACPRLGLSYREAGRPADSLRAFQRCLGFAPGDSDMLLFLGLAYERGGDDARADELFVQTLAVAPSYADATVGRGRVALRRGQPQVALALARAALAKSADSADGLFVAGLAALRVDDRAAAHEYLEHGLRLRDDADVRLALGMLAEAEGRRDDALAHYAAALQLDPQDRDAEIRRARLLASAR